MRFHVVASQVVVQYFTDFFDRRICHRIRNWVRENKKYPFHVVRLIPNASVGDSVRLTDSSIEYPKAVAFKVFLVAPLFFPRQIQLKIRMTCGLKIILGSSYGSSFGPIHFLILPAGCETDRKNDFEKFLILEDDACLGC
jgi:hypothetical protein